MKFKLTLSVLLVLGTSCCFALDTQTKTKPAQSPQAATPMKLGISTDHPKGIYKPGETVQFTVSAIPGTASSPEDQISYVVDDFTSRNFGKGNIPVTKGTFSVPGVTLKSPGFLRCRVVFRPKKGKVITITAAAAFSPLTIQPSTKIPADFDKFWKSQKEQLAKIKIQSNLTPIKIQPESIELFDAQITSLGKPVSGYFAKPKNAKPKSLSIVLWAHGAGVHSSGLGTAAFGAKMGMLSMDINAHGIPNGKPAKFYGDLKKGELKNYRHDGREDREKVYFKGMFLRLVRAIDFLTLQPEWDGKTVCVIGHSQGGAQALVAGGLDSRVTFIAAGVPAMCDHTGATISRVNGWPKFVPKNKIGEPDAKITKVSQYYDAVNFAKRCNADAIMSVGFCDTICPPSSCYAAYNQLTGKKQIINKIKMGHAAPQDVHKAFIEAMRAHVKKMK